MKARYIYLTAASILSLSSCEEMELAPEGSTLTATQKSEVYGNDASKSFSAVSGAYMSMSALMPNAEDIKERHNDFGYPSVMLMTDANGEDMVNIDNGYNWFSFEIDFQDRSQDAYLSRMIWSDLYRYIFSANAIVASIDPAAEDKDLKFNLAQGLALRAFSYFQLAQLYQFNIVGHETSPCVPLITEENADAAAQDGAPRATVREVYDRIYSDIDEAIRLLSEAQEAGASRPDKRYVDLATAYGIRARVNLVAREWAAAASDAQAAIDNAAGVAPASISDVAKPTFSSVDEPNWMWGIIVEETDDVATSGIVNWPSHIGSLNYGYANYSSGMKISKKLFESISDTDVRKGWWLDEDGVSANLTDAMQKAWVEYAEATISQYYDAYTNVKFGPDKGIIANDCNANDIPLMRIEEMYLIKAEGLALSGGDGLSVLNSFIQTYRDPQYSFSGADIQTEIWRQRRIELWGEGMSWFDLMRYGVGIDRRNCGFQSAYVYVMAGNDANLLWPIPYVEINANPALSTSDQNPSGGSPSPVRDSLASVHDEKVSL